jgi:hypothetical protein
MIGYHLTVFFYNLRAQEERMGYQHGQELQAWRANVVIQENEVFLVMPWRVPQVLQVNWDQLERKEEMGYLEVQVFLELRETKAFQEGNAHFAVLEQRVAKGTQAEMEWMVFQEKEARLEEEAYLEK